MSKRKGKDPNAGTNFYEKLPTHLTKKIPNPDIANHGLELPFRAVIVAASGGGKTTFVLELLSRMPRTFNKVVIVCRSAQEPLYQHLIETSDPDTFEIFEYSKDGIPSIDDYKERDTQKLIVYDDLVSLSAKELAPVIDAFIRGRKLGCSLCFLTQSYYSCPKIIRLQANYLILKKINSVRDINMIMREMSLGVDKNELEALYAKCTKTKMDFLLICLDEADRERKFRHNFLENI